MRHSMHDYGSSGDRGGFERMAEQGLAWLRSRSADHWLMFLAGLVIGLIIA